MPKLHKNLFFHLRAEEFEREIERLEKDVPKLADSQIKLRFMTLRAKINDGHTFFFWEKLEDITVYETNFETRKRTIKIPARQLVRIEHGNYDPISEERGELIGIAELKILAANGEISCKGKLLLKQFEKDGYTFIKTYKGEFTDRNSK